MKIHGLEVANVTHKNPGNNLPPWVRAQATERGYGDATDTLSLFVQDGDIAEAFACAAQGNGSQCVMAQAGQRLGAKAVYFYRTTAWVDFGEGPIVRFQTTRQIYTNVIEPFDRGARDEVMAGIYHLTPFTPSKTMASQRGRPRRKGEKIGRSYIAHAHTERVVMASRVGESA